MSDNETEVQAAEGAGHPPSGHIESSGKDGLTEHIETKVIEKPGGAEESIRAGEPLDTRASQGRPSNFSSSRGGSSSVRGRAILETRRENIKYDPSSRTVTDDPNEIRKQVEFYFSDSNLPMDKFLVTKVGGSKNNPVDISIIHGFGRMKRFTPFSAVVSALKDSQVLDVIDDKFVKRKVALPESALGNDVVDAQRWVFDTTISRSVYAVRFLTEALVTSQCTDGPGRKDSTRRLPPPSLTLKRSSARTARSMPSAFDALLTERSRVQCL
jgi:lupus La protein